MEAAALIGLYSGGGNADQIAAKILDGTTGPVSLKGLKGSSRALVAACLMDRMTGMNHMAVLGDKEEAAYFYNDLAALRGQENLLFLPSSFRRSVQYGHLSSENTVLRLSVLERVMKGATGLTIVTYPEALAEKVVSRNSLRDNTHTVRVGEQLGLSFLREFLCESGFVQADFVSEPGQFSVRGSIVDVFSFSEKVPYRMDFDGDAIASLRTFDPDSQRSIDQVKEATIAPDFRSRGRNDILQAGEKIGLPQFMGDETLWWMTDRDLACSMVDRIYRESSAALLQETDHLGIDDLSELLVTGDELVKGLEDGQTVLLDPPGKNQAGITLDFRTDIQPAFRKNFNLLREELEHKNSDGYRCFILSDNPKQLERIRDILADLGTEAPFEGLGLVLHEGFIDHDLKLAVYTDHQIFDRFHKYRLDEHFSKTERLGIREVTELQPGDYVVHTDHGIGRFGGLETIDLGGRKQEALRLVYKDNDILFVNIHSLHRVSRYKGRDDAPPRVYKLGTGAWQKLKQQTKKKVGDIARQLIKLYARRKSVKGFSFSPDSYLQQELESSFMYEDTEDQVTATRDTKAGMEADFPMDRLICGDVGFGKTEVAIRAAFKAVADSKQVAVLVPTTILALQHYRTFTERLDGFPCRIEQLSRLKKPAEQKKIVESLANGQTDIVIGTHRLVSKDVKIKNLGLLIIDEEQKFGVAVKEKLRNLRVNVDTLSLTATPIPRTLQLSLMGARDLSVINTPPPNRQSIETELHTFNESVIRDAIEYEAGRDGQVFVIHNRVKNIEEVKMMVDRLCPHVRSVTAHGKMEAARLEKIMMDFIEGRYDVLIATTIVESGLDIPNANTMIIHDAHQYGLSDLYQLRGRIGRSNRKAFCYLLAPPLELLPPEARRRLRALEDFTEPGSGFNIAMQDLDIRGAGNLLGAEQSGFIAEIGFDTYHRILDEAMHELREQEFRDLYAGEEPDDANRAPRDTAPAALIKDCQIDTDLELLLPDSYVENVTERLRLYRELDGIRTAEELEAFRDELTDRFGSLPDQAVQLLQVVRLRWKAISLGFEKIVLKKERMVMHFPADQESPYYRSPQFSELMQRVQGHAGLFRIREQSEKLTLTATNVHSVNDALEVLNMIG